MKKYSIYDEEKKLDRAWFDSTNAIYGECQDNPNDLKTVKIVFKNGAQYIYEGTPVNNWLLFRESESQGSALYKYFACKDKRTKKPLYETRKIEDADLIKIQNEYQRLTQIISEDTKEENPLIEE